ncbi:hypothetical protein [Pseudomonas sp. AS2.8]|uniref:hypothetical protein n=1 Tax=Pseudomonas sp. AS2.8 TaxID=2587128 RepID=UPI00160A9379|nr:hypothetical protein [Pseudomonas sp. AS2.8]MBB2894899.1 hypothetical protein [Pseudomonas sp. AS2.8]
MTAEELLAQPAADYRSKVQRGFFRRLPLRPTATFSVEAKKRQEQREQHLQPS